MLSGDWEPWVTDAFVAKLTELKEPTVIDVGANVGWYTLLACRGGAKRVVAFEPNRRIADLVRRSIAVNGYDRIASCRTLACGATPETRCLGINPLELGGARILPVDDQPAGYTVEVVRLDDELPPSTLKGPIIIKIDVEGFEPDVIEGAANIIAEHHPLLFIEHHQADKSVDLLRKLTALDYTIRHCRHSGFVSAPLSVEEAAVLPDAEMFFCS
jgi:FkbM family methyltransferase